MAPCLPCGKLLVMASPESDCKWPRTDMQVLVATWQKLAEFASFCHAL